MKCFHTPLRQFAILLVNQVRTECAFDFWWKRGGIIYVSGHSHSHTINQYTQSKEEESTINSTLKEEEVEEEEPVSRVRSRTHARLLSPFLFSHAALRARHSSSD